MCRISAINSMKTWWFSYSTRWFTSLSFICFWVLPTLEFSIATRSKQEIREDKRPMQPPPSDNLRTHQSSHHAVHVPQTNGLERQAVFIFHMKGLFLTIGFPLIRPAAKPLFLTGWCVARGGCRLTTAMTNWNWKNWDYTLLLLMVTRNPKANHRLDV